MQRLVYNPRVYAFTKDRKGQIRNISNFITAGNVRRVVNAVSSAELTLRNPDMIFTTAASDATVAFMPMDPITIWLQRLRHRPVQVFTGFLDTTPYLQLYPGTITIKASCTLKRLQYTFFDPALPYTQSFLAAYGWINKQGTVLNLNGLNDWRKQDAADSARFGDGSVAELLFATLKHIGHWNADDVFIERLPQDLFDRLSAIYNNFDDTNQGALDDFTELLRRIVGASDFGSGGAIGDTKGDVATGNVRGADKIVPIMIKAANHWNVPAEMVIATWLMEWPGQKDSPGNPHYGWFQWDTKNGPAGSYAFAVSRSMANGCYDCGFASDCFAQALGANKKRFSGQDWHWLVEKTQGVNQGTINNPLYRTLWDSKVSQAQAMITHYGKNDVTSTTTVGPNTSVPNSTSAASRSGKTISDQSSTSMAPGVSASAAATTGGGAYGAPRAYGHHAGVDISMPEGTKLVALCDGEIAYTTHSWYQSTNGKGTGLITLKSTVKVGAYPAGTYFGYGHSDIHYKKVGDKVKAGELIGLSGSPGGGPHLHFFINTAGVPSGNGNVNPTSFAQALLSGKSLPITGSATTATTTDTTPGSTTGSNIDSGAAMAQGAAFAATFNLPTALDTAEAMGLSGERSLLNDKPLLPFIQQLCEASLRSFQSLPDGSLFAFYPDYFGEMLHHKPYWEIDDIEILDGHIQLSDDALVTHMYVVGDTTFPASTDTINKLTTTGIVSVFNAFLSATLTNQGQTEPKRPKGVKKGSPNDPTGMDLLLNKDEAVQFINRFGARPMVEEMPMIHSHYFEFFLAYQRFMLAWSRQFISTFEFTFMPELFPGGKVGFPDHGLQMYIEDVTHTWDYTTGFTTTANLSAPSVYKGHEHQLPPNMVKALIDQPSG